MSFDRLWPGKIIILRCSLALAAHVLPTPALSQTEAGTSGKTPLLSQDKLRLAQYTECSQRVGPFVTQTTAWNRWRDAQSQGYPVSNGVAPCYEGSTRGYCFFVFYRC
jgi:hypothetical protein